MAGHSKWAKIKRGKASEDAKRGAAFTKLGNQIAVAAKQGGGDPDMNPALSLAVQKAKEANMPNTNIEKAIKRGTGELGGDAIEEILYEGYGPGGIAIMIECATDNRNRTYAAVRTAFTKNGGNMAEPGAVAYLFERKGIIRAAKTKDLDADQLLAIDAGAEEMYDEDDSWAIHTDPKKLGKVERNLKEAGMTVKSTELSHVPKSVVNITEKSQADKVIRLMDVLDELDDVTETYSNFDIDESLLD